MNIFNKTIKETTGINDIVKKIMETSLAPTPEEEWIWVEGYKGTDRNMCCRDHQYELGVQYDMPEDSPIEECVNGFHLCLDLNDVFKYYHIGAGNRFFKVKALVRKPEHDKYGHHEESLAADLFSFAGRRYDKLAAKSIILQSELTIDEILKDTGAEVLPEQYKHMAIENNVKNAVDRYHIDILLEDGYSLPFATYIIKQHKFETAHAYGSQKDLSMDMKVWGILKEN